METKKYISPETYTDIQLAMYLKKYNELEPKRQTNFNKIIEKNGDLGKLGWVTEQQLEVIKKYINDGVQPPRPNIENYPDENFNKLFISSWKQKKFDELKKPTQNRINFMIDIPIIQDKDKTKLFTEQQIKMTKTYKNGGEISEVNSFIEPKPEPQKVEKTKRQVYEKVWKDAGCTTKPPWGKWQEKQTLTRLKASTKWTARKAKEGDKKRQKICYGNEEGPKPKPKVTEVSKPELQTIEEEEEKSDISGMCSIL